MAISQELINAQKELERRRKADGVNYRPSIPAPARVDLPSIPTPQTVENIPQTTTTLPETVKAYPSLLIAFIAEQRVPVGRVYELARAIDTDGRGWLDVAQLRAVLIDGLGVFKSWKRLKQLLAEGDGLTWEITDNGRLRYYNPATIFYNLGGERFYGLPIDLPVSSLLGGIKAVKAHFYAAWHSSRQDANPITRETVRDITSVPESTQREYERVAKVQRETNIVLIEPFDTHDQLREAIWQHGYAFKFKDYLGKHGERERWYIARTMPNSYKPAHDNAPKGRLKKLKRKMTDLVNIETRGSGGKFEKIYFAEGVAAAAAYNRSPENDIYYMQKYPTLTTTARRASKLQGINVWGILAANA